MRADFEEGERLWSLWVEYGVRMHALRLSYVFADRDPSAVITVAQLPIGQAVLDAFADAQHDPAALSEQLIDMLSTLASEKPSADCVAYLRWRFCEAIHDVRRSNLAQNSNTAA
jgi:hypothetical protein